MYLAKVRISPNKSGNAYELHRALWQLFPHRPDDSRSFLFRVERQCRQSGAEVLLQSEYPPVNQGADALCLASKPVNYQLAEGQR
uniref:type I-E CRISPR-associated protein Cas6/Cse3/CasE n=1 Tax=Endozoicomonas sp. ONNA2 TaxID=2828741 RepID=UPI002148543F